MTPGRPELLAPAGDWESLRAAVANGADAVYFGLPAFNARARATNFTLDELPEVMQFLHARNVRGFVALNTLIFSDELPEAAKFVAVIANAGVDAVIVQDLGLVRLIRRIAPTLPIHASTQMTLTEPRGIAFVKSLGVQRVVLARELSLEEIRKITAVTDMPVEVFVHGALCVAYSGQCLTSEALGGRSANRGQCAQACRLPYEMLVDGEPRDLGDKAYLLSPQDLAAYDWIAPLIEAGAISFKIEGRLKGGPYVAATTQTYRKAIDAAMAKSDFHLERKAELDLAQTFSRGFTPGFLAGNDHQKLVRGRFPKSRGVKLGRTVKVSRSGVQVELAETHADFIKPGDGVLFDLGTPDMQEPGGRVWGVEKIRAGIVELQFKTDNFDMSKIPIGCEIWKTDDPALRKKLEQSYSQDKPPRREAVNMVLHGTLGGEVTLFVSRTEALRDPTFALEPSDLVAMPPRSDLQATWPGPVERARMRPTTPTEIREQLARLGDTPFELAELTLELPEGVMLPKSVLNELRRRAIEQLSQQRESNRRHEIVERNALELMRSGRDESNAANKKSGNPLDDPGGVKAISRWWSAATPLDAMSSPNPGPTSEGSQQVAPAPAAIPPGSDEANNVFIHAGGVAALNHRLMAAIPSVSKNDHRKLLVEPPKIDAQVTVLCRSLAQLDAVLAWKPAAVYCDFEDLRLYRDAVAKANAANVPIGLAPLRIWKPGEEGFQSLVVRAKPDIVLVRNLASIDYFANELPDAMLIGDFSLNVANDLTADVFFARNLARLVPSFDLNFEQFTALMQASDAARFEAVVHQHMPMFHMEHCVFAAFLSSGKDHRDCGRPCDRHRVELKDRVGAEFPVHPDTGCRNTVFNSVPQSAAEYIGRMKNLGVHWFRIDLLRETPPEIPRLLDRYMNVIAGKDDGRATWKSLNALNQLGVTRGTMQLA